MRKGLDKTIEREVREGDRARGMRERRIGDVICGNKNRTKTPILSRFSWNWTNARAM